MSSRLLAIAASGGEVSAVSAVSGSGPGLGVRVGAGLGSPGGGSGGIVACRPNVAATSRTRSITTTHVPVPEQPSPSQPANVDPDAGVAVSVTGVSCGNPAEQSDPQLMPAGSLVTVPLPPPDLTTVRVRVVGVGDVFVNSATTLRAWSIETVQVPVPEQPAPVQPVKAEPLSAVAVSVTSVPPVYPKEQSGRQLMAPGLLVTVPLPVPLSETLSVKSGVVPRIQLRIAGAATRV